MKRWWMGDEGPTSITYLNNHITIFIFLSCQILSKYEKTKNCLDKFQFYRLFQIWEFTNTNPDNVIVYKLHDTYTLPWLCMLPIYKERWKSLKPCIVIWWAFHSNSWRACSTHHGVLMHKRFNSNKCNTYFWWDFKPKPTIKILKRLWY